MDGSDGLHAMEVIIVLDRDVLAIESATHHWLGVLVSPSVSVPAGGSVGVLGRIAVARRLKLVGSLHLDTFDEGLEDLQGVRLDLLGEVVLEDLADESSCGSGELLLGGGVVNIRD